MIGSRSRETAAAAAHSLAEALHLGDSSTPQIASDANEGACQSADIVILAIPEASYADLLPPLREACRDKIVLSTAVPFPLSASPTSAGEKAQELLPEAHVVAGLHTVSHAVLESASPLDEDAILTADDPRDAESLESLLQSIPGLRVVYGGPLQYARITESLTHLLIRMNRTYHAATGIRITGIPSSTS